MPISMLAREHVQEICEAIESLRGHVQIVSQAIDTWANSYGKWDG